MHLEQLAIVVDEYDSAIEFFVGALGFELVEDSPSLTTDGRPKRWVVVRPPGAQTGILLARADGAGQAEAVGQQFAGRVGLFLRVEDFDAAYGRMSAAGVEFVSDAPRRAVRAGGRVRRYRREPMGSPRSGMIPPMSPSLALSVQLYSIREEVAADLPRSLARLAEIGLTRVEPYDIVGDPEGLRDALAANRLTVPTAHARSAGRTLYRVFDAAATVGVESKLSNR